jgi:hypothetical protein
MAVPEIYQRVEIPQARVTLPSGGNTFAEQFGTGLQRLGQAASDAALRVARANTLIQERNDAETVAKAKPQAILAYDKIYNDAVAAAPQGAAGFVEAVQKATADYNAKTLEGLSSGARAGMEAFLGTLQADTLRIAHSYQSSSDLAKRSREANEAANAWINVAAQDPDALPSLKSQIHDFVASQHFSDTNAAAALEHDLIERTTVAAMHGEAVYRPQQFLANRKAGKWNDVDPDKLALAAGQAESLLQLQQAQAAAAQANRAVGLRANVDQAVALYKSGIDFAGFPQLAEDLQSAGQTELLQTLTNWKSDAVYARSLQTMAPAALLARHEENVRLATQAKDPIKAAMHLRHAEIDALAAEEIATGLAKDAISVAVRAKVAAPTDVLGPLLGGNTVKFMEAARARETARVQTREFYGVQVDFFTADELQRFMTHYNGLATAQDKAALLNMLAELPGEASAAAASQLKQVAGGDQIPMYLSFLSEDRALGDAIIAGADLLKHYPKMLPDHDALEDQLDRRFGSLLADYPDQQLAMKQAATDFYIALVHSRRGEHGGVLDISLLNQAFARVTGGAFPYDNGNNPTQVIIPPRSGMTEAEFEKLVFAIDDDLLIGQSARSAPGHGRRGPVFSNGRPVTAQNIQEDGTFVSVGRGLYRVLINGEPIRDAQTDKLFVLDMNPLVRKASLE